MRKLLDIVWPEENQQELDELLHRFQYASQWVKCRIVGWRIRLSTALRTSSKGSAITERGLRERIVLGLKEHKDRFIRDGLESFKPETFGDRYSVLRRSYGSDRLKALLITLHLRKFEP